MPLQYGLGTRPGAPSTTAGPQLPIKHALRRAVVHGPFRIQRRHVMHFVTLDRLPSTFTAGFGVAAARERSGTRSRRHGRKYVLVLNRCTRLRAEDVGDTSGELEEPRALRTVAHIGAVVESAARRPGAYGRRPGRTRNFGSIEPSALARSDSSAFTESRSAV